MQYFKPEVAHQWVGDCMPFYHEGVFHFYYLIDEEHHRALGGLGGHQWAHATSTDLVTWVHHPLALAITEENEGSICTGSVLYHGGTYYAFHAVRRYDWTQRLGIATSADSIHFTKHPVPPHADPPAGYDPTHYRDPFVFQDPATGQFHMLVTARREHEPIAALGGCLAHLVSDDLEQWQVIEPFLLPGFMDVPECAELFAWNGWYYLVYSNRLQARYLMARTPFGPWQRPSQDVLDGAWSRVMKTAAYHNNRRLGVAWIGTRAGDEDAGRFQWGGHAVFREVVQLGDGTLGTKFPPEMIPATGAPVDLSIAVQTQGATGTPGHIRLEDGAGMAAVSFAGVPRNVRITLMGKPVGSAPRFGVRVRESVPFADGVSLELLAAAQRIELHDAAVGPVEGLDAPFTLEIVLKDELIDVCVNNRYCIINRCPQQQGDHLTLFCHQGAIEFEGLTVQPLVE